MKMDTLKWLDQVDMVDPFFGDASELSKLAETAPTSKLKDWLRRQIEENKAVVAALFSPLQT